MSTNAVKASIACDDTDGQDLRLLGAGAGRSGLSLKALEGRICSFAGRLAMQMHDWLHLLAEFDERDGWNGYGIVSCAHWLSWACAVSPGVAREYMRVARALPDLPLIDAAFAAGRLSYSKVRAATRLAGQVDEEVLLDQSLIQTAPQLERTIRAYRGKVGSGFAAQQRRRAKWSVDADGMWVLTARLPAEEGALVAAALRAATSFDDSAEPDPGAARYKIDAEAAKILGVENEHWTGADALVEVARLALAAGPDDTSGEDRHLVVIHVDAEVMDAAPAATPHDDGLADSAPAADDLIHAAVAGSGSGPLGGGRCHLQHGSGVDPVTALRLSCDAPVIGAVHKFVGDGIDLCLGRQTRKIPANLRRALGIRDGGCRWPSCHRVTHLQAHHVWHWAHGGPTDPINLVLLCRTHHMLLHEGGFSIAWALGRPGTSWVVTDPTGCPVSESRLFSPGPSTRPAHGEMADPGPDAIRSGWAGERFRVAETCGVLLDNSLARHSTSTDGVPSDTCPGTRTAGAKRADSSASGCETTPATAPKEASKPVEMSEQIADHRPPPRDEWFDNLDLTGVSDEELIDGSYWRKLMDELVEAELAQAGPA